MYDSIHLFIELNLTKTFFRKLKKNKRLKSNKLLPLIKKQLPTLENI